MQMLSRDYQKSILNMKKGLRVKWDSLEPKSLITRLTGLNDKSKMANVGAQYVVDINPNPKLKLKCKPTMRVNDFPEADSQITGLLYCGTNIKATETPCWKSTFSGFACHVSSEQATAEVEEDAARDIVVDQSRMHISVVEMPRMLCSCRGSSSPR
jgi:hypothetical protein